MTEPKKPALELQLPPRWQALVERTMAADAKGGGSRQGRHMGGGGHHGMHRQVVRARDARGSFLRLLRALRGRTLWLLVMFALVISGTCLSLLSPLFLGRAIDALKVVKNEVPVDMDVLWRMLLFLLLVYVGNTVVSFLQGWLSAKISQDTVCELRRDLFAKLQTLPLTFFDGRTHGEILSRMTNDIEIVAQVLSRGVVHFFGSVITLFGALASMLLLSGRLTLTAMVTVPFCFLLTKLVAKRIRAYFLAQQTMLGLLNGHIEEIISAQKTVKAFNHEEQAIADFAILNQELRRTGIRARILSGIVPPLMNLLNNIGYALLAGYGGWLAMQGDITIGVIAAFIQYTRQFSRPVNEIANQYNDIQSALAGAERVFAMMDEEPEPADAPDVQSLATVRGELSFDNVCFSYKDGEPVLRDFTLQVQPGQKIALVGSTGAGKTTVVSLLMRFYEPRQGRICLDGVPITQLPRQCLRQAMAMVLQDTQLFSGTVRDNIRYGRLESSDAEVEAAARTAGADAFISRLPQGYDTILSENGGNLSQGQRQLLSIARAVLADPPVLILDEATSNVDTRTEMCVQRAMIHLMKGRTCLVIAHRLSTIRDADVILVMAGGRIVERGARRELLALRGAYWQLEQSQAALLSAE
ncbi:ABC transporter ATP-binding protein [Oligosphaera ethanolica]|uniref:ATP-binding cassette subfamily B protein n=1 Tax=Oligosphaera ethanolica TaxID=760260 RepID=A0AAE3VD14_9BACT|nr:ABC transporter ATP-binding protein [Oligosphaera ethanolica]MDQ0288136.1 ATP-binding cassette subfamily B protein [Oligosphaera ethanolica]NLE54535.1 ABC transporter ATP-binding protein [Lentisphaerota bacterium]